MNNLTAPSPADTGSRTLWRVAGGLMLGYVVLTFAGVALEQTLMLGDKAGVSSAALTQSSLPKNFAGGYIEFLATLTFLLGALLIANLLRADGPLGNWLASCAAAGAVVATAVTVSAGFAAGAAALYDGHHGADLSTVVAVNDIRNFAFFLSGGLFGVFALAVAAAIRTTGRLPRWVSTTGFVVGVLYHVAIPAARTGVINAATLLGFVWMTALGVAALRQSRSPRRVALGQPASATV
ncbi:MAG TPA: hypothetical protein VLR26_12690 [Frankiaceae bacterium]|nr:hypothetical protein [Frankiaceae bacterium]